MSEEQKIGSLTYQEIAQAWSEGRLDASMTEEEQQTFWSLEEEDREEILTAGFMELSDEDLESVAGGLKLPSISGNSCRDGSCNSGVAPEPGIIG